jgi:hypothetical protein
MDALASRWIVAADFLLQIIDLYRIYLEPKNQYWTGMDEQGR